MSGNSSQPVYAQWQFDQYTIAFEGNSVACILSGVYFLIAGTNLYLLQKKKYRILWFYSAAQLVFSLVFVAMSLYISPVQTLGIFNITDTSPDATSPWPAVVVNVAFVLNTWLADGFFLYRCYVVCQGNMFALAVPILLYFTTVGSSLAWLVVSSIPGAVYSTHSVQVTAVTYWSCSTAMTVCASLLISARLLMHRKAISSAIGLQQGAFYLGYMAMTLESAMLYTVFAIITLIVFTLNSPLEDVFIPVLGVIQAIAPSLIIYRIARGISFNTEQYGTLTTTALQFASTGRAPLDLRGVRHDISEGSDTIQVGSMKQDQQRSDLSIHEIKV